MNATEIKKLEDKLTQIHGPVVVADVRRLGAIACKSPDEDTFLELMSSVSFPGESSGVAREQFIMDTLVYPDMPEEKARVRRFLQAMPAVVQKIAIAVEALSCGDYVEPEATPELAKELDAKWEFGWDRLQPVESGVILLATDPTSGALARSVFDAREEGADDLGVKVRQAVLAFVRDPDRDAVETLLSQRPGLLMPLWVRCQKLAGVGSVELGKG
jgi:hypothetical protein